MAFNIQELGGALLEAGAPLLKELVIGAVGGGLKGKIAGTIIDALAEKLGAAKTPEAVYKEFEKDPVRGAAAAKEVESEFVQTVDIGVGNLDRYLNLLETDAKQEGIIGRLWRPLFALVFTLCFAMQIVTVCWLMWTRQWGTLAEIGDLVTFLTFMNVAGCAVLGIQIWKKTEEKKSGVA